MLPCKACQCLLLQGEVEGSGAATPSSASGQQQQRRSSKRLQERSEAATIPTAVPALPPQPPPPAAAGSAPPPSLVFAWESAAFADVAATPGGTAPAAVLAALASLDNGLGQRLGDAVAHGPEGAVQVRDGG
jgi:hypothetical protein